MPCARKRVGHWWGCLPKSSNNVTKSSIEIKVIIRSLNRKKFRLLSLIKNVSCLTKTVTNLLYSSAVKGLASSPSLVTGIPLFLFDFPSYDRLRYPCYDINIYWYKLLYGKSHILFEGVARFSIMKVVFTLRSLLLSLNPDEELDAKGDGCCDCIKLINKSVWELGTFDFDLALDFDLLSSGFSSFGVNVGTTWRLAAEGEIDFQTAIIDSRESLTFKI